MNTRSISVEFPFRGTSQFAYGLYAILCMVAEAAVQVKSVSTLDTGNMFSKRGVIFVTVTGTDDSCKLFNKIFGQYLSIVHNK